MDAKEANEPLVSEEGVDLTLVRWMLSLSPAERVARIEEIAQSLREMQELNRER